MHRACPHCHYEFDKGHGYFLGAMYASYVIMLAVCAATGVVLWLAGVPMPWLMATLAVVIVVVGPLVAFPYSRMLWVWMERDGHLHDGIEDVARLQREAAERHGLQPRPRLHAVPRDQPNPNRNPNPDPPTRKPPP